LPFKINAAFYPSGVCKSSTGLWLKRGAFICDVWQVTLCDVLMVGVTVTQAARANFCDHVNFNF